MVSMKGDTSLSSDGALSQLTSLAPASIGFDTVSKIIEINLAIMSL